MPITYDLAMFQSLYSFGGRTYSRAFAEEVGGGSIAGWFGNRMDAVEAQWGVDSGSILIVGCGYGFEIELFLDRGWTDVWGVDASPHIASTLATEARADVLSRILTGWTVGVDPINDVKSALQGIGASRTFDVVIDADAASSHSDAELPAFYAALEGLAKGNNNARVVHMVTPLRPSVGPGDSALNWKLPSDWKATAPSHTWVDIHSGQEIL